MGRHNISKGVEDDHVDLDLGLGLGDTYASTSSIAPQPPLAIDYHASAGQTPYAPFHPSRMAPDHQSDPPFLWYQSYGMHPVPATNQHDRSVQMPYEVNEWELTEPVYNHNGKRYAGWYREMETSKSERNYIASYLLDQWGYTHVKDGMKKTKNRMMERIGQKEANVLLRWKEEPALARTIARLTMSNSKNPDNVTSTEKGKAIMDLLLFNGMNRSTGAVYLARWYGDEALWDQSQEEIACQIYNEYRASMARLGREPKGISIPL